MSRKCTLREVLKDIQGIANKPKWNTNNTLLGQRKAGKKGINKVWDKQNNQSDGKQTKPYQ